MIPAFTFEKAAQEVRMCERCKTTRASFLLCRGCKSLQTSTIAKVQNIVRRKLEIAEKDWLRNWFIVHQFTDAISVSQAHSLAVEMSNKLRTGALTGTGIEDSAAGRGMGDSGTQMSGNRWKYRTKQARECARCNTTVVKFENHHIIYERCTKTVPLCFDCHDEVTLMNTAFVAAKPNREKMTNYQRWFVWLALLSIEPRRFASADMHERRKWMESLYRNSLKLQLMVLEAAPRGLVTDDVRKHDAGSVVTANDPQCEVTRQ